MEANQPERLVGRSVTKERETMDQTKYIGQMSVLRLKAKYPHLYNDPVHRWRAETGIELIHEEPDWDEYQRILRNWQLMTPEQKATSDAKAIELFGVDNMTYAKRIRMRMLLKRLYNA
jgi:hypothetical protein